MEGQVRLGKIYVPSEDVVAREIQGELIIIPIASGVGDLEDEIFTLNETGRAIWDTLDGKRSLQEVVKKLRSSYEVPPETLERDVLGLAEELLKRKMLVAVKRN